MKILFFILCLMACNFVVYLLIIRPYEIYANKQYEKLIKNDQLTQFCEHHKVPSHIIVKEHQALFKGCRRFFLLVFGIILVILSYLIF